MNIVEIKLISKKVFDGFIQNSRSPNIELIGQELEWYSNENNTILGTIVYDKIDKDYAAIIMGPDEIGRFRAFDVQSSFSNIDDAKKWLIGLMKWQTGLNKKIFKQGDPIKANKLFETDIAVEKQHPYFTFLNLNLSFLPAKEMIQLIMPYFIDIDGNFIEQFQTTGFDSRLWELYLFTFLIEEKFGFDNKYSRPDFIVEKIGEKIAIEAVTLGRKDSLPKAIQLDPNYFDKIKNTVKDMDQMAIRFGSSLYSKLNKKYWELEHIKDFPLIIAIADFHEDMSMQWSSTYLINYLYGYKYDYHHNLNGDLIIKPTKIDYHEYQDKKIPSGFFYQPNVENISGILFSSNGTISKFNRMGKQIGFGLKNIKMIRKGTYFDKNPNASKPKLFEHEINETSNETWGEGIELFHNPNAKRPINMNLFPNIAHHHLLEDGNIKSYIPSFHPFSSQTFHINLEE